jgi:hypothetical protein
VDCKGITCARANHNKFCFLSDPADWPIFAQNNRLLMTAGYSGTPLAKKLGIGPSTKLLLVNPPKDYEDLLGQHLSGQLVHEVRSADLVHLFARSKNEFEKKMKELLPGCKTNPKMVVWISWYKKMAKIPTDLNEDIIRSYALSHGLVDVKVCAVSEQWSGLKLVVPLALR